MIRLCRAPFVHFSLLLVVGLAPMVCGAGSAIDELTKVLPDDVVYFVATGGGAAVEGDFQKSILGKLWHDPGTQSFVGSIHTELMRILNVEAAEEEIPRLIAMAMGYGQLVQDRPLVIGIAGAEAEEGPPACVFAIIDAGSRKSELAEALTKIEEMIGEHEEIAEIAVGSLKMHGLKDNDDVPLYWGWVGSHLVFAVNDAQGAAAKYVVKPRAVATDHLKNIPNQGDLLAVYYDVSKIWDIVNAFAVSEGEEEDLAPVKAAFTELGLDSLGAIAGRVGFSGSEMVSDSFVEAPAPRTGLLAAFKPVDPALLGMVDAKAVTTSAFNCDIAGIYDTVMKAIKAASPDEGYPEIQEGLAEFESEAGFSIREGLLKSLGGPVVFYSLPAGQMIEAPMGGAVVSLKLNDAALFEKTMKGLGAFVDQIAEGMLQIGEQKADDGQTIHVWASPALAFAQVMPTWAIIDDQVIIGSNTALCKMGLKQAGSKGQGVKALRDTDGFKKIAARLPKNLLSLTYTDSEVMFNQMLMQVQQVWPLATMGAMQEGIRLPVMLPQLGHIAKEMQPSCEYSHADAAGFHSHYQGSGLEVSLRGMAGAAFGAGVAMPALARTRQLAFRMTSGTNLSIIGKACMIYADDHDDKYPPNLEVLVEEVDLAPKTLESKRKPDDFDGPSYVYIPGQTLAMNPGNFVAYEDPGYCIEGVNVLHLDSHVEFMKPERFREELKATYERLGREMPEIEFMD